MTRTGSMGKAFLGTYRDKVISELVSLGAYSYYSASSGSQYIKFKDPRIGSLRIGDHKGKSKYHYKWNLVIGGKRKTAKKGNKVMYFFPIDEMDEMFAQIRAYRRQLLENYGEYDPRRDPYAHKRNITRSPRR